ncbi:hypothetical protein OAS39_11815 [Pirellulales bacterium]|nr:hypothetical protein [Pirellulales bacterium]
MDPFYDPRLERFAAYGKMWIDGPDGGMYFKHAMGRIESKDFIHWSKYDHITLNADASAGSAQVELLDSNARRIRGFDQENAIPIHGNGLDHRVTWKTKTLRQLPPGPHILRVHLNNATLYALTLNEISEREPQPDR